MRDKWEIAAAVFAAITLGIFFGQPMSHPTQKSRATQTAPR